MMPGTPPALGPALSSLPAPYSAMYGGFLGHAYRGVDASSPASASSGDLSRSIGDMRTAGLSVTSGGNSAVMNDMIMRSNLYKQSVTTSLAAAYQRGLYRYHPYMPQDRVRSPDT